MRTFSNPLLLPKPRRIKILKGAAELRELPLQITGADQDTVNIVNECCKSLPDILQKANSQQHDTGKNRENALCDHVFTGQDISIIRTVFKHIDIGEITDIKSENIDSQSLVVCNIMPGNAPVFNSKKQFQYGRSEIKTEAYRLRINPNQSGRGKGKASDNSEPLVIIDAETTTGVRHALFTLVQLIRQYGGRLPSLFIEDAPAFPNRGVMLDISRDRIPHQHELLKLVDRLASWKINHFQLYTEHSFAYSGHEEIWQDSSAMTPDEIRELDSHCKARGITLAANQNCFGHLTRWLKHPQYAHLAETQGDWDFNGFPKSGPFSLCPLDPGSLDLVEDLQNQLLPCFSSNLINIGCDETFDVGQGRSKKAVAEHGLFKVYWDYVSKVMDISRRHGFKPMFWADMWLADKKPGGRFPPEDSISLAWGYEPDADFLGWCRVLKARERSVWVCPGTCSWRSITGRKSERQENQNKAAHEGVSGGANGYLITEWGDLGHRQQYPVSLLGLATGAHYAWHGKDSTGLIDEAALHVFGDWSREIESWMDCLGDADLVLRSTAGNPIKLVNSKTIPTPLKNATCIFTDLEKSFDDLSFAKDLQEWHHVKENLVELENHMPQLKDKLMASEIAHTLKVAHFATDRAILRREPDRIEAGKKSALRDRLKVIMMEHSELWHKRSRPGGLAQSLSHYQRLLKELEENV